MESYPGRSDVSLTPMAKYIHNTFTVTDVNLVSVVSYDNPVPEINKQLIFAKCCILLHTLFRNRLIKVCSFHVKCVKLNCNLILIIEDFVKLVTN